VPFFDSAGYCPDAQQIPLDVTWNSCHIRCDGDILLLAEKQICRNGEPMRVLLVEDDPMIGDVLEQTLRESSYAVDWVQDGETAINAASLQHYDIVLLDLGLPRKSGQQVLETLRSMHLDTPVLIITARDGLDDRIRGLDAGADDYVIKPFDIAEIMARMRALFRRAGGSANPVLTNGRLSLDPVTREARLEGQSAVQLSSREFSLVQALLVRPGAILSRSALEDRIYGWEDEVESNAVEYLIHSVRKKLSAETIKNVRGVGWVIAKNS
jgi:two-component system OmpR family response regulator